MTGEQLERSSYDKPRILTECSECAKLRSVVASDTDKKYFASASYDSEELITGFYPSSQAALKRAAEMAEYCWAVKSYVEIN